MSKKNKTEMKKPKEQIANVPNPPVPNRANTPLSVKNEDTSCKNSKK